MMKLKVFISHSHDEKDIALAWQTLLDHISQGAIEVWLSSDTKPTGGMKIGAEWRDNIYNKLSSADFVIAVISPKSIERPWIIWECGVASGTNKERGIIPVVYSMSLSDFEGPLSSYQAYCGEDRNKVVEICERLLTEANLTPKTQYWSPIIDTYLSSVRLHRPARNASPAAVSVWMRRIETYIRAGRISELPTLTKSMYTSFGADKEVDVQIHELLSQIFLEDRKYDLALSEVSKALTYLPDDLSLLHRMVLIQIELKELNMAISSLNSIYSEFEEARSLPEFAGLEGRVHRELYYSTGKKDELEKAIKAYEVSYKNDPFNYYCGVNAASLNLIAGKIEEAKLIANSVLEVCKELITHHNVSFWLDFTMGDLFLILEDYDNAGIAYSTGLSRNPSPSERQKESVFKGIRRIISSSDLSEKFVQKIEIIFKTY
ncbi:DUF4071 domain-containing protein [Heliobacterium chlorum]|uniref:DUF4071 domain-containing protein n=1 Tax=Heliobacterium chlorum TaxID=2698 RepID=A0ABR7T8D8_HELCL|nr:toll/interleukin-1 receptor domain-containing protein [Heliobacterium chlorum]MBC9786174.1 DUF4071 domain-containing protein [Heliobacterium chlorum]